MPTATFIRGGETLGPTVFPSPKQADLRGWWNALRRARPGWCLGFYPQGNVETEVTYDTITFDLGERGVIYIARRQGRGGI